MNRFKLDTDHCTFSLQGGDNVNYSRTVTYAYSGDVILKEWRICCRVGGNFWLCFVSI